jgi:hypothetical protein
MKTKKGLVVNRTAEMVSEGVRALEALPALVERLSASKTAWVQEEVAEISIQENDVIEAQISVSWDDGTLMGYDTWQWTGEAWVMASLPHSRP